MKIPGLIYLISLTALSFRGAGPSPAVTVHHLRPCSQALLPEPTCPLSLTQGCGLSREAGLLGPAWEGPRRVTAPARVRGIVLAIGPALKKGTV